MPTFDVVSDIEWPEVTNAVDQANREISTRFDFKGTDARVEQSKAVLTVLADDVFQVGQAQEILSNKLARRKIDLACLSHGEVETIGGSKAKQEITLRHGIDKDLGRTIVKLIKNSKLKVQAAIQGEQVRVTGKKRDDLQEVMNMLRKADIEVPLQFVNLRD